MNWGGSFLIYLDTTRYEYITLTQRKRSRNMDTPKEEEGIVGTMEIYPSWTLSSLRTPLLRPFTSMRKFVSTIKASVIWIPKIIRSEWYNVDGELGIIQEICKSSLTDSWVKGAALAEAATASNIAVIGRKNNGTQIRVYYQDSQLRVQERWYENGHWKKGWQKKGPHTRTPILTTHRITYRGL